MIRFSFTPSTIRHSVNSLLRESNKAPKGKKRNDLLFIFNLPKIVFSVVSFPFILAFRLLKYVFLKLWTAFKFLLKVVFIIIKAALVIVVILAVLYVVFFLATHAWDWYKQRQASSVIDNSDPKPNERPAGERLTLTIGNAEYVFVWIPAGEFEMGSPTSEIGRDDDETLRRVKLTKGFWMLETETTQALYEEVMGENPSRFKGENLPVERVSWNDATKFCEKLSQRLLQEGLTASLPTEAQWERACRAGTTTPFSFGSALNGDEANCDGNDPYGTTTRGAYLEKTTPVKSYARNPWGLYDMHGNVWEWTSDYYAQDYQTETAINPKGSDGASPRAYRGGGWSGGAGRCRSANRDGLPADSSLSYLGFRFILCCDEPSEEQNGTSEACLWGGSSTRKAGTRQTLTIGDAEYGFVWIPAGEFDMGLYENGSREYFNTDELFHHVKLTKGFWMLETETPQALYQEVVGENPSSNKGDNFPVERVSWNDATKFCAELTKRLPKGVKATLPTEAQWEYACRAGTKTAFSFGDDTDFIRSEMNGAWEVLGKTKSVKSYAANPWGLYNMHGNVMEWCLDYYASYPWSSITWDKGTATDPKTLTEPKIATYGNERNGAPTRVIRGGSWFNADCRSGTRYKRDPDDRSADHGFRFILSCD